MMRMSLIVVSLGTLIAMELGTSPRKETSSPDRFEQIAIDVKASPRETLSKADRLEVHGLQPEAIVAPSAAVQPRPPATTAITAEETPRPGRRPHNKNEIAQKT